MSRRALGRWPNLKDRPLRHRATASISSQTRWLIDSSFFLFFLANSARLRIIQSIPVYQGRQGNKDNSFPPFRIVQKPNQKKKEKSINYLRNRKNKQTENFGHEMDTHSSGRWTTVEQSKLQNTHEIKRNLLLLVNSRVINPESSVRISSWLPIGFFGQQVLIRYTQHMQVVLTLALYTKKNTL